MQSSLKTRLAELIPIKQKEIKDFKDAHKDTVIGTVTVDQVCAFCRPRPSLHLLPPCLPPALPLLPPARPSCPFP